MLYGSLYILYDGFISDEPKSLNMGFREFLETILKCSTLIQNSPIHPVSLIGALVPRAIREMKTMASMETITDF